jgi:hypothetical protein
MLRDEIEDEIEIEIQLEKCLKIKKTTIKRMSTKFNLKIK